ncbi:MAG: DUF2442 domain-containing protein [Armatimonadetes bacterium]|nr:DUF2442 domain-containing protein [Armatimonadota bacterium]
MKGYILEIEFDDGEKAVVDLSEYLYGEVFAPLKEINKFRNFRVDEKSGTIVWDTGADFCPDFLYRKYVTAKAVSEGD